MTAPQPSSGAAHGREPVLSISGLSVTFATSRGQVDAVRDVSLAIAAGETVAVVGESGSGKTTLAASVNRLLAANGRITAGTITLRDLDHTAAIEKTMTSVRGNRIGLVPQRRDRRDRIRRAGRDGAAARVHPPPARRRARHGQRQGGPCPAAGRRRG